jgi:hypothetical protein
MPRLLLNLLSALSLLLALILMAFWVRSHWTADRLEYRTTSAADRSCREYFLHSARGILVLTWRTSRLDRTEAYDLFVREKHFGMSYYARRAYDPREWVGMYSVWNRLGFRAYASHDTGVVTRFRPNPRDMERVGTLTQQERGVYLPHWFVALILLAPGWPLVRQTTRFVTARLRPSSLVCPSCGYDLRGTPERCPECGASQQATGA